MELIAQHIACRAQSTAKAIMLAQQARLTVGAAVPKLREIQGDQSQMTEPRFEFRDPAVVRPQHAERAFATNQLIRLSEESLRRNQHRYAIGDRRVVGDTDESIFDDTTILNEWHRRAP